VSIVMVTKLRAKFQQSLDMRWTDQQQIGIIKDRQYFVPSLVAITWLKLEENYGSF